MRTLIAVAVLCLFPLSALAIDPADVQFVQTALGLNPFGRYMEGSCTPTAREGWAGFPTQFCTYTRGPDKKDLPVVLLDPDPNQLSRWLLSACIDAGAANKRHCAERLMLQTTCQSGSQFPVAGFVDEGSIFTFRDGVTTRMKGLNGVTVPPSHVAAAKNAVFNNPPEKAKTYGRISSTTREQFAALVGKPVSDFEDLKWLDTVRSEYQVAWGKDANRLMTARVKAQLARFDRPAWGTEFDNFCIDVAGCPAKENQPKVCARKWKKWTL
jgi:hypothetical protein